MLAEPGLTVAQAQEQKLFASFSRKEALACFLPQNRWLNLIPTVKGWIGSTYTVLQTPTVQAT